MQSYNSRVAPEDSVMNTLREELQNQQHTERVSQ